MRRLMLGLLLFVLAPGLGLAQTAQDSWDNLKQLHAGDKIEVVDMNLKSYKGRFVALSDGAISLRVREEGVATRVYDPHLGVVETVIRRSQKDEEVSVDRANVFRVTNREKSHRARNALIGLGIGAGAGLAAEAVAAAGLTDDVILIVSLPVGVGIGAAVGAAMPASPTIYRAGKRAQAVAP